MLFILPFLAFSQEEAKFFIYFNNADLDVAFEHIEEVYNVRFSYEDAIIDNFKITIKNEERTLTDLLVELNSLTNLDFEIVAERYIIVNTAEADKMSQELDDVVVTSYLTKGISKNKDGRQCSQLWLSRVNN